MGGSIADIDCLVDAGALGNTALVEEAGFFRHGGALVGVLSVIRSRGLGLFRGFCTFDGRCGGRAGWGCGGRSDGRGGGSRAR